MDIAQRLLELFGGNNYHARAKISAGGGYSYELIQAPLTTETLELHLKGEMTLGAYPVLKGSDTVKWIAWDVDSSSNMEQARQLAKKILTVVGHLPHAVEFSGSKGYHIFLFLENPMPARQAKDISEWVRDSLEIPKSGELHVECYPKQASVETDNPRSTGNLLKLPLGLHPVTHNQSIFVNPDNGWENGPEVRPSEALGETVGLEEVAALRNAQQDSMEVLANALSVEWNEGKRHELAVYLSGYLYQVGWTYEQTETLVRRIIDVRKDDYGEMENRLEAIKDTYVRATRGKAVAGFSRLQDALTGETMKLLTHMAPDLAKLPVARQIDNIRFDKGLSWMKERQISNVCWAWLTDADEGGRILRVDISDNADGSMRVFWFSHQSKTVVDMTSVAFLDVMYQKFGLNNAERLVGNVMNLLILRAREMGELVQIYRLSYYDEMEHKLYVNFGGSDVYVCDGEQAPYSIENGTDGIFFEASQLNAPSPDFNNQVDIWKELVDPINFARSDEAKMDKGTQREMLKAWFLAFFFRSIMPTRPLLAMLGAPGSGKTTAMRLLLRMVEGPRSDVSNIAEEKPDSWRVMLEKYSMIVLDNLEGTGARWLARELDLVSTGSVVDVRKLYTTNESYQIVADAFVGLTAVSMPFTKETVFERMLVLNMDKLESFIPSHVIQKRMEGNYTGMLADLLVKLNLIVRELRLNPDAALAQQVRMADFAVFCARIRNCERVINGEQLVKAIRSLGSSQQSALANSEHSAFPLIQDWLETGPEEVEQELTVSVFFNLIRDQAKKASRNFRWKQSNGFVTHLKAMQEVIRSELGVELFQEYDSSKGRPKWMVRFHVKHGRSDDVIIGATDGTPHDSNLSGIRVDARR